MVQILECRESRHQIVIPVFYNVEPTHVRNQTGNFGRAFNRLLESYQVRPVGIFSQNIAPSKSAKEQIWRNALKEAGSLSGCVSSNNGSEATLIDNIIADVLRKLKTGSSNACDDKGLVGITSRKEIIMHLLRTEFFEFGIVGIWGMGGIGKTTIAEVVFHQISCNFDSCCFLGNVRETEKKDGLTSMRNKLISKLLNDEKLEIDTPRIGDGSIKDRLSRTKVLLVLDDIDDSSQLEKLIGERGMNQFGQGSRVIVTTRDKHVLNAHDITCVYDMEMLGDRDALELFNCHALRPDQPMEPYLEISKKIVEYAQGVPLALKILGSSLHGKTHIEDWKGELKKLKKLPNMKILGVLKTSYDSLNDEEKEIFLDIVCFFRYERIDKVKNKLDGFYVSFHSGMKVLADKSLIKIIPKKHAHCNPYCNPWWFSIRNMYSDRIGWTEAVEMHDLVEEMGRNIVIGESKEVGSRSRIWREEDARDVLTKNKGTDKIKAILFDVREANQMNLDPQVFAKMHNLKFLKIQDDLDKFLTIQGANVPPVIEFPIGLESISEGIRYLYWRGYPLGYLPPTFNPTNLVRLKLTESPLKQLWSGRQNLCNLKVLSLVGCERLVEIPDLSLAMNLEELKLKGCRSLNEISSSIKNCINLKYLDISFTGLTEISSSIQHLKNLEYLDFSDCELTNVPSFIQHLTSLTYLNLSFCSKITVFPSSIQHLKSLTYLDLSHSQFTNIPSSIHLKSLTHLDLSYSEFTNIPSFIQHLTSLKYLNLYYCKKVTEIPSSIQHLKNLLYLNLSKCSFTDIPSSIQHLTSLTSLNLSSCNYLTNIPSSMQNLTSLTHLDISHCFGLSFVKTQTINNLPKNIQFLYTGGTF